MMKLIFDVGSNMGKTLEVFESKTEKLIGFEPNPTLSKRLKQIFSKENVIIDDRGLSNENGTKTFRIGSYHTISTFSDDWVENSRFSNNYTWKENVEVKTITLDSAIDQYGKPDYIKIDVEGYEYEVLTSFTKLLENTIISFEWAEEQKNKINEILNHLKNLGYNLFFYTEADEIKFDEDIDWVNFENFSIIEKLNPEKKEKWGMIYFKYKIQK